MTRARMTAAVAVLAGMSVVVMAQKISTPEDLDKAMKANGQANQAMRKAIGSGAFADARAQLKVIRQTAENVEAFMAMRKQDEGVKFAKNTQAKVDGLDKVLAAAEVDQAAMATAIKELGGTCQACHMEYRTQDANGQYILRPGKMN